MNSRDRAHPTHSDIHDCGTLLGLFHGYDQARRALERLSLLYHSRACQEASVQRELSLRAGEDGSLHQPIYEQVASDVAALEGLNRGAQTAVLAAFALVSDKAEELRCELVRRCPELGDEIDDAVVGLSDAGASH